MIKKENSIKNKNYHFDLCIIGSGHAALPIAIRLLNKNIKICLIPGGSFSISNKLQETYQGKSNIVNNSLDKHRLRVIGGTSKIWGGRCIPFKKIDFEKRNYAKNSGWPISYNSLKKYYSDAASYLDIGEAEFSSNSLITKDKFLIDGFVNDEVITDEIEKFSLPTDFSKKFASLLSDVNNIYLFDNSSVVEIVYRNNSTVSKVNCKTVSGTDFSVTAKNYVLAAGGIENARLLLHKFNFSKKYSCGNKYNNVGRYFMSHFSGIIAKIKFNKDVDINNNYEFCKNNIYSRRRISISQNSQRKNKILNFSAFLHHSPIEDPSHKNGILSLIFLLKNLRYFSHRIPPEYSKKLSIDTFSFRYYLAHIKNVFFDLHRIIPKVMILSKKRFIDKRKLPSIIIDSENNEFYIHYHVEHEPLRSNYVSLTNEVDCFGLKKTYVTLKPSKNDIKSIIKSHNIIDEELRKQKKGKLFFINPDPWNSIISQIGFGGHLIGTTRMSNNYKNGVVNKHCKVFEIDNLYIAGSSVFPTGGEANPALTIVALSLRLADHLSKKY